MKFAVITPSYEPDFGRCRVLCRSVERYLRGDFVHYVIVDRRDVPLFRQVEGPRTRLLVKEQVLPWWIRRPPVNRRWWLNLRGLPVRGWIIQQLIKLAVGESVEADHYVFVDSDLAFVRPFDLTEFERGGKLRLFRVPGGAQVEDQFRWHRAAARLLGLPVRDYFGATYIGAINTWRRDHLLGMYEHIRRVTGKPWMLAASRQLHLAEYILYGVYVEHVLGEGHRHFYDDAPLCHISWEYDIRTREDVDAFLSDLKPHHVAVMLSSNLKFPVESYEAKIPFQPA